MAIWKAFQPSLLVIVGEAPAFRSSDTAGTASVTSDSIGNVHASINGVLSRVHQVLYGSVLNNCKRMHTIPIGDLK